MYDLLYVRLVILVIRADLLAVIRNPKKLLKPGGYLQWEEMDVGSTVVATAGDDSVGTWRAMVMMVGLMKGKDGIECVAKLPGVLEEEGSEGTVVQLVRPEMALLKSYSASHLLVWPEIASSQSAKGESAESAAGDDDEWACGGDSEGCLLWGG